MVIFVSCQRVFLLRLGVLNGFYLSPAGEDVLVQLSVITEVLEMHAKSGPELQLDRTLRPALIGDLAVMGIGSSCSP